MNMKKYDQTDPNWRSLGKRISFILPRPMAHAFKVLCTKYGLSMSDTMVQLVDKWMEENKPHMKGD